MSGGKLSAAEAEARQVLAARARVGVQHAEHIIATCRRRDISGVHDMTAGLSHDVLRQLVATLAAVVAGSTRRDLDVLAALDWLEGENVR